MKTLFLTGLLVMVTMLSFGRTIHLAPNSNGGLYKPKPGIMPGDTLLLQGDYSFINLDSIIGAPGKPIVIMNSGLVRTGIAYNYAFVLSNSKYVQVNGQGSSQYKYGIKVGGLDGQSIPVCFTFSCDNLEVKGCELCNSSSGFLSNDANRGCNNIYLQCTHLGAADC